MTLSEVFNTITGKCLFTLSENDQAISRYDFAEKYSDSVEWEKEVEQIHTYAANDTTLLIIRLKEEIL